MRLFLLFLSSANHYSLISFVLLALFLAGTAPAQDFVPGESWYTDSIGTGVAVLGQRVSLVVETNGIPGFTDDDHIHPYPPELNAGMGDARNYRLSPTRRWLYVFGEPSSGSGTSILFFRIPTNDGAPLEQIVPYETLPAGLAFEKFLPRKSRT